MSLIQAALDKAEQTRTSAKPAPRAASVVPEWTNSILEQGLEKKLREVQGRHRARRSFWTSIIAGAVLILAAYAFLFLKGGDGKTVLPGPLEEKPAVVQVPVAGSPDFRSVSVESYRLGEITNLTVPVPKALPSVPSQSSSVQSPSVFSPPPVSSLGSYRLHGITDLGDRPRAIINNQIVGVGDLVSRKALVKEIGANEVLLEVQGQRIRLKL